MRDVYILRTSVSFTNKTKFYNIIKINQNVHWKYLKNYLLTYILFTNQNAFNTFNR